MTSSAALGARQESESEYDLRCAGMNCELPDLLWGRSATPSPAEVGEGVGVGEAEDACAAPVLGVEEPSVEAATGLDDGPATAPPSS